MSKFDYIKISTDELPQLGILGQLGIDMGKLNFQTKDLECHMEEYRFKRCKESGVLALRDPEDNLHGVTRIMRVYDSIDTIDKKESYWIEFTISIKRGVVEFITLSHFYKMGNNIDLGYGISTWVKNEIPLDKTIPERPEHPGVVKLETGPVSDKAADED